VEEVYDYASVRTERASWPAVAKSVAKLDGCYALWRGEIGLYSDEGFLMVVRDGPQAPRELATPDGVLSMSVERLHATVRPTETTPPTLDGVYAHRWFEFDEADWDEFLELSDGAWPDFEAAFDGTRIIGFWRSLDTPGRVLLVTRYPDLATWERSRPNNPQRVEGVAAARQRFMRRAELTKRTIVRVTRLVAL